jgi:hypothetical protein
MQSDRYHCVHDILVGNARPLGAIAMLCPQEEIIHAQNALELSSVIDNRQSPNSPFAHAPERHANIVIRSTRQRKVTDNLPNGYR